MKGIEIQSLHYKRNGKIILQDVTVTIPSGQFIGLLGPNGTGKSTFLKILAGLIRYENGHISILSEQVQRLSTRKIARLISYMPQTTYLETNFTVEQIVQMGRYPYKNKFSTWCKEDKSAVEEALTLTGIQHLKKRYVPTLSGGERQLVYLAKVIAQDTPIILLDEPTSDLDIYHQVIVTDIIRELQKLGKTIIAAIHDINFSARICDQCLLLKNGKIIDFGTAEQIISTNNIQHTFQVQSHISTEQVTNSKQIIPLEKS